MSALLVGNFLSGTLGTRAVGEELAAHLAGSGWSVLTTSDKPGRVPRLLDMLSTVWRKRHNYAVAHVEVFSGLAFTWAEAVCLSLRLAGKPYVLTLHGGNLPAFARRWPRRMRRLLGSAAAVTTPSRYLLEQMQPYQTDLRLFPNPLDLRCYRFQLRQAPQPHLVWLRAFHEIYNPRLAPRAIARLVQNHPTIHLNMIGPDKGDGSLQRMREVAVDLGVADRIALPGKAAKSAISEWLNKGDIFLNTTNVDNTPISIMEAMACGLCIVSTNVGGIPYFLKHEQNALLVPPDDPEAMAAAVNRILTEPHLAERLSGNARQEVEQFDWSVVLPQWEKLLTDVAEGNLSHGR